MASENLWPEDVPRPVLEWEGVRVEVPQRWEARIGRLQPKPDEVAPSVLHASTVSLSGPRADFGGGVVERLGQDDVFVALIEFGPAEVGTALFKEVERLPTLLVSDFHRNQLQRRIRGQAGKQHFFTLNRRAFCLYVVLGSIARAPQLVKEANTLLQSLEVSEK